MTASWYLKVWHRGERAHIFPATKLNECLDTLLNINCVCTLPLKLPFSIYARIFVEFSSVRLERVYSTKATTNESDHVGQERAGQDRREAEERYVGNAPRLPVEAEPAPSLPTLLISSQQRHISRSSPPTNTFSPRQTPPPTLHPRQNHRHRLQQRHVLLRDAPSPQPDLLLPRLDALARNRPAQKWDQRRRPAVRLRADMESSPRQWDRGCAEG